MWWTVASHIFETHLQRFCLPVFKDYPVEYLCRLVQDCQEQFPVQHFASIGLFLRAGYEKIPIRSFFELLWLESRLLPGSFLPHPGDAGRQHIGLYRGVCCVLVARQYLPVRTSCCFHVPFFLLNLSQVIFIRDMEVRLIFRSEPMT